MFSQTVNNALSNPGFESPLSVGWQGDPSLYRQGLAFQSELVVHSGKFSLKLASTKYNTPPPGGSYFGVYQVMNVGQLQGKSIFFSGWLYAKDGGTAVLRIVALSSQGAIYQRELDQPSGPAGMTYQQDILDLPNDPNLVALFLSCTVQGVNGSASFDDLTVSTDPSVTNWTVGEPDPGPPLNASVSVDATTIVKRIPRTIFGMNLEYIFNGQNLWNESTESFDPNMLSLTENLGLGSLRFPGGVYSDFYNWTNGIGPYNQRPTSEPIPANYQTGNAFGTDEAMAVAADTNSVFTFTANPLTGTADQAAAWVQYVNNGQRRVDYWEIGNEMYLQFPANDNQPYNPGDPTVEIQPAEYAQTLISFAAAMKAVDPTIKIGADMDFNYAKSAVTLHPDWPDTVLSTTGSYIDFVSVHNGFAPALSVDGGWDVRTVYSAMLAAPILIKNTLQNLSAEIDAKAGPNAPNIRIAVTEWGPFYQTDTTSRFIDHVKTLGSALYAASTLKVLMEDPRTDLACAFKLSDTLPQGWIGPRNGVYIPKAPYYALQMFTQHFGPNLLKTTTESPTYNTRSIGWVDAVVGVPYLDTTASISDDGMTLYVAVINKHFDRDIQTSLSLNGFSTGGGGVAWTLNGTAIDANTGTDIPATIAPQASDPNGRFFQGGPGEITLTAQRIAVTAGSNIQYLFPAHSVTILALNAVPPPPTDQGPSRGIRSLTNPSRPH